jgi:hypothetical protein
MTGSGSFGLSHKDKDKAKDIKETNEREGLRVNSDNWLKWKPI